MQKRKRQPPSYRQRKGYNQAIVTLTDRVTRYRKDYWLGPYGSPESRELYHRVLAHWEANGQRLPVTLDDKPADLAQVSVAEVLNAYWTAASASPTSCCCWGAGGRASRDRPQNPHGVTGTRGTYACTHHAIICSEPLPLPSVRLGTPRRTCDTCPADCQWRLVRVRGIDGPVPSEDLPVTRAGCSPEETLAIAAHRRGAGVVGRRLPRIERPADAARTLGADRGGRSVCLQGPADVVSARLAQKHL